MKYIFLALLFIMGIYSDSLALDKVNARLHAHAQSYKSGNIDFDHLHDYLVKPAQTQAERVEVFYYWMAQNIVYDVKSYQSGAYLTNKNSVLVTKRGVCEDYANLFQRFCDRSGIECYKVSGFAKGFSYEEGDKLEINHAWNVVKVNGKYQFVDITWGSGYVDYNRYGRLLYYPELSLDQVLTQSNDFREKHLPAHPMWQLTGSPIRYDKFVQFENFAEMRSSSKIRFEYLDSISNFAKLSKPEREIMEAVGMYRFHADPETALRAAFAFHEQAQELALGAYYRENLIKAKQYYQQALKYYGKARPNPSYIQNAKEGVTYCEQRLELKR
ncbi:MAG: transglutaminase domain-containing protein [Bacteroidota bacterium]